MAVAEVLGRLMIRPVQLVSLHDRFVIEPVLRRNVFLHLYALGDLDPFFWPYTVWYGWEDGSDIRATLLLYAATETPTLLALADAPFDDLRALLRRATPLLPPRLYAHVSPECLDALAADFDVRPHGPHVKMALRDPSRCAAADTSGVEPLSAGHLDELHALYAAAYPGNWFDPRMLETGQYFGLRAGGRLVSAAGVHVYSPALRVAALGNVATHPAARRRGFAARVTARLCLSLLEQVDHVGLNVKADNPAALACYERLGFARVAAYEECALVRRA